ncbi:MAG: Dam family site-specific DNA-(adenine-N6)-methyltransferase [Desulfurellales bacterium]|nr:MAG: Dam family site-specific DNA-(adenine-N6)-methyltransferase [Desulfurellales bacterium]
MTFGVAGGRMLRMNGLFRWAGGKGRIADKLFAHIDTRQAEQHPARAPRWIEPFVGGGAMALEAMRRGLAHKYILADASADVMSVYETLYQDAPSLLLELRRFQAMPKTMQQTQFLWQRRQVTDCMFTCLRAMRLLILQACGFNGLYRVNKSGVYNVPFGRCATFDFELLAEAVKRLREHEVKLLTQDFEQTTALAGPGDIVYADPPYLGTHSAYTAQGFNVETHRRLAAALWRAASRDVVCWLSGSDCEETRAVYGGTVYSIPVSRSMSCKGATRGTKTELLIRIGS